MPPPAMALKAKPLKPRAASVPNLETSSPAKHGKRNSISARIKSFFTFPEPAETTADSFDPNNVMYGSAVGTHATPGPVSGTQYHAVKLPTGTKKGGGSWGKPRDGGSSKTVEPVPAAVADARDAAPVGTSSTPYLHGDGYDSDRPGDGWGGSGVDLSKEVALQRGVEERKFV